jgi:hypothetical protein
MRVCRRGYRSSIEEKKKRIIIIIIIITGWLVMGREPIFTELNEFRPLNLLFQNS